MISKAAIKKKIINSNICFSFAKNLTKKIPRIFVYHNFCSMDKKNESKMDAGTFRWQMEQIKDGWNVISFKEYLESNKIGKLPHNSVILTIDDGYLDFYNYAYPVLKELNLPATFFVTYNFVDGKIWLWPDKIKYILLNTKCINKTINFKGFALSLNLSDLKGKLKTWGYICDFCIKVKNTTKNQLIKHLETDLAVNVPEKPEDEFAAVNWGQLLEMEKNNIEIGSHTLNHPILSKISEKEMCEEIIKSKHFIEEKINSSVKTFCYPNSGPGDINETVIEIVKKAGYSGAVYLTGVPNKKGEFKIPRLGLTTNRNDFLWKLSGMEYIWPVAKGLFNN